MVKEPKGYWYFAPAVFFAMIGGVLILHSIFDDGEGSARRVTSAIQDPHYTAPMGNTTNFAENAAKMEIPAPTSKVQYVCLDSSVAHEAYNVVDNGDTTPSELEIVVGSSAQ